MSRLISLFLHQNTLKIGISAENWCLGRIFWVYLEVEIPENLKIPEAQMKNKYSDKKTQCNDCREMLVKSL